MLVCSYGRGSVPVLYLVCVPFIYFTLYFRDLPSPSPCLWWVEDFTWSPLVTRACCFINLLKLYNGASWPSSSAELSECVCFLIDWPVSSFLRTFLFILYEFNLFILCISCVFSFTLYIILYSLLLHFLYRNMLT